MEGNTIRHSPQKSEPVTSLTGAIVNQIRGNSISDLSKDSPKGGNH